MNYVLLILRRAQKQLANLDKSEFERVRDAIALLSETPRPNGCKKLVGRDGWRIRIGNYRVIYEIDEDGQKVTVLDVGHRRNIYS